MAKVCAFVVLWQSCGSPENYWQYCTKQIKPKTMKQKIKPWQSVMSCMLIFAIVLCSPLESLAQSSVNRSNMLENGTQLMLRVDEDFKADSKADTGTIHSIVETDVYSADGSKVLIKAGSQAFIEFSAEPNGSWGKAGKICLTHATTKTIDNKRVSLRLSNCKNGGSKLGGVIILSVLLFPIGLISGCMKGSMPKIQQGTTFNASVMQGVVVE